MYFIDLFKPKQNLITLKYSTEGNPVVLKNDWFIKILLIYLSIICSIALRYNIENILNYGYFLLVTILSTRKNIYFEKYRKLT